MSARARRVGAVVLALLLAACGDRPAAPTPLERAARDEVVRVAAEDPAMRAAIARAQGSLDGFLALLDAAPPHVEHAAVKVGIRDGADTEYFWLGEVRRDGEGFVGTLDNAPRLVRTVRAGQRYRFTRADIVDWLYYDRRENRMIGNFTGCALLAREPPAQAAEFRRAYRLRCD